MTATRPDTNADADGLDTTLVCELDSKLFEVGEPDTGLIDRVKSRVMDSIRTEIEQGHRTVRAADNAWVALAPGIERKILWEAGASSSWMVRLAPGSVFPAHLHPMDEECVVMQGSLRIGDILLEAGDFHVGRQQSMHGATTTDTGALIYLRGALSVAE